MASITATGLGSGLDISGLVATLVSAEGAPVTARLDRQQQKATAELSALGSLTAALSSLQVSLRGLSGQSSLQAMTASSSHESLLTLSASEQASAGQYQVEVLRLAQTHKLASETFSSTQAFGGSAGDELVVAAGGESFTVDLSTAKTLAQLRDAINSAAGNPGIRAALIQVDESRQVLVVTAAGTGQAQAVSLTTTLSGGPALSFETANRDAGGGPLADLALLDAAVRIDGVEITRSGNQVTDAIEGVTIDLKQAEPGTLVTLGVSRDLNAISSAVSAFVNQYNALVDTLTRVSGFKGVGAEQPPLFGDAATRGLSSRLRVELGRALGLPEGGFSTLSEIGLRTGADGRLTLDTGALSAALEQDLPAVGRLLGADGGLAGRLDGLVRSYLEGGGVLDARTKGLQGRLERIEDSRKVLEQRLSALELRYQQQFTAMDVLVGQLMATSDYLSQQMKALNALNGTGS